MQLVAGVDTTVPFHNVFLCSGILVIQKMNTYQALGLQSL